MNIFLEKYLEHAAGLALAADQARNNLYTFTSILKEYLRGQNLTWDWHHVPVEPTLTDLCACALNVPESVMHTVSALDCPGDNLECLLDDFCGLSGPAICHPDRKEVICEIWVYLRIHQLEEAGKDFSDAWDIIVDETPPYPGHCRKQKEYKELEDQQWTSEPPCGRELI